MLCPSCNQGRLDTRETFSLQDVTWRTKVCSHCGKRFASQETLLQSNIIPKEVRDMKRKVKS